MNNCKLKNYARVVIKKGLNLQKNQTLVISSPIECADFARLVAQTAYDEGARQVVVRWNDERLSKITYKSSMSFLTGKGSILSIMTILMQPT